MTKLTPTQEFTIVLASRLLARHGDVLSDFEAQLVREIGQRWLDHRADTEVTDAEWPTLERAAQALADVSGDPQAARLRA